VAKTTSRACEGESGRDTKARKANTEAGSGVEVTYCPYCRRYCWVRIKDYRSYCSECGREVTYDGPPLKKETREGGVLR